jgi:glucose/arabinose dehydrogenase
VAGGDEPFTVPADNPFVDVPGADPTIWASGLRNPWRYSFDRPTGDLWIGDVGQGDFEEINRSNAIDRRDAGRGANFGWSAFEGFERFNEDQPTEGSGTPAVRLRPQRRALLGDRGNRRPQRRGGRSCGLVPLRRLLQR